MNSPVLTEIDNEKTKRMVFYVPKKFENKGMPTPYSDNIEFST